MTYFFAIPNSHIIYWSLERASISTF